MPVLTHDNAIKEYWEQVKDKYPNVEQKQFIEICQMPFKFIKFCIREGSLATISIKYFGKFKIFPSKMKKSIIKLDDELSRGYITQEEYQELKTIKLNQLNQIENDI